MHLFTIVLLALKLFASTHSKFMKCYKYRERLHYFFIKDKKYSLEIQFSNHASKELWACWISIKSLSDGAHALSPGWAILTVTWKKNVSN